MSTPRPHEPKGTYVAVIREEHGWHDGRISGYLIDDDGTVEIDSEDGEPYTVQCAHRRDYHITEPCGKKKPPSKREQKRKDRDERRAKRAARG